MSKFTTEQIEELVQHLQGTCKSLEEGVHDVLGEEFTSDDLVVDDFEYIYGEIFLCDDCGWWYELTEQDEESCSCKNCLE